MSRVIRFITSFVHQLSVSITIRLPLIDVTLAPSHFSSLFIETAFFGGSGGVPLSRCSLPPVLHSDNLYTELSCLLNIILISDNSPLSFAGLF